MMKQITFDQLIKTFRDVIPAFPDKRRGKNRHYSIEELSFSAFAVFFTQSPSFRAHDYLAKGANGHDNLEALFGLEQSPCANQIRNVLDGVPPESVFPAFDSVLETVQATGHLESFRGIHGTVLMPLDGTWYFSSQTIHCQQCSTITHRNGEITYYHSAITPVIVAPDQQQAIALRPEFIVPQDGHAKQDCEIMAAKRWIGHNAERYSELKATLLGDDLYAKQPMCEAALQAGFHFIFVCKPTSHPTLYEWVDAFSGTQNVHIVMEQRGTGDTRETSTYRYVNQRPLRETDDALLVNWCEVTITNTANDLLYHNAFITDYLITDGNVPQVVRSGRTRWKVENEHNNTLKTKGSHLEHNFGHGKEHLSALLATLNLFAFLLHTVLELMDPTFRVLREWLPTRQTFFDDIRALMRYLRFASWDYLLTFMMKGLTAASKGFHEAGGLDTS